MPPQNTKPTVDEIFSLNGSARKEQRSIANQILPNILEFIGNTPLVRLNKIPQSMGIKCQVLAKCEFYGPGGSHKDRIALSMIEGAEREGLLKPGGTIIEPTSGNTGIGIAIVAAVKGYKCIFTMTDKNSQEKVDTLSALGAKIVRTPGLPLDHPDSYISTAKRIHRETPNSILLDQYTNPDNPGTHYNHTGIEILQQCNGHVDMLIVGAGTGGAITGLGRRMKDSCPGCTVVGVDPVGSFLAGPLDVPPKPWEIEGIGHNDFTPVNLDKSVVDKWYKSNDMESFVMARRLISEEGLLVGGSSGSVLSCALKAIQDANLTENHKCVILFPDSIRNYMSKFIRNNWMLEKNLIPESSLENPHNYPWWNLTVAELEIDTPVTVSLDQNIKMAVILMQEKALNQLVVVDENSKPCGILTLDGVLSKMVDQRISGSELVKSVMASKFRQMNTEVTLGKLFYVLQGGHFAVVSNPDGKFIGIATQKELTKFIFAMH